MATKKKLDPAVRYLRYELTNSGTPGNETSHYIDLARDLSMVNRRLYRQGRDYHVKKITIVSSNTPSLENRISVATIPSGWPQRNAWKRGFQVWRMMYKNASQNISGDIEGTWSDFKVYLSNSMRSAGINTPVDNGGNGFLIDEWAYSQYVSPDGTTSDDSFTIHMLGDHSGSAGAWNSVGLVKSYGESRATVQAGSPAVPGEASDDPLVNVFDYGTEIDEVIDLMEGSNDLPPYDQASYPGDDVNGPKPIINQDTTLVDGRAVMGGFSALCGLLEFEIKSAIANDTFSVLIELAPGKYRGIHAEVI
ncbi:MAG: putative capsid protein [Cressdnaviricota sp.]|nr:MAG: putative capsid protein [Cressdnaviricota sp.]